MTVDFAAKASAHRAPLARILARRGADRAANDNRPGQRGGDHMLHAALRHFAAHGLGAAREARKQAEKAFFTGDRQSYDWWLGVCRTLDRRLAAQLVRATARAQVVDKEPGPKL
jgi:hypothetical protein